MSAKKSCCCGICKFDEGGNYRECAICLKVRCMGHQGEIRPPCSVCANCLDNAEMKDELDLVFPRGKDDEGRWIDPTTQLGIPTCEICGLPSREFLCSKLMLALGNKCSRTGLTLKEFKEKS